jgi:hypothetical protein
VSIRLWDFITVQSSFVNCYIATAKAISTF